MSSWLQADQYGAGKISVIFYKLASQSVEQYLHLFGVEQLLFH